MRPAAHVDAPPPPTRLLRHIGLVDAVFIGLGAMVGAGIFAALAPAAQAAEQGVLISLLVAAAVAYGNATSSATLAAKYPEAGGAYAYGRHCLGGLWGFVAGWCFIVGKLASCAAMALTFAAYAFPAGPRWAAVAAIIVVTAINRAGVAKTAMATRVIVVAVVTSLAVIVFAGAFGGAADVERARPSMTTGVHGILQGAGFLFFAFAGYARIATLGEEVVDPARTIRRAIPVALGLALALYAVVALTSLASLGAGGLAAAGAPLAATVESGRFASWSPVARVGAAIASLGVLLSLQAGVSRTAFAMARNGDLPRWLSSVHPLHRVPDRAVLAAAAILVAVVVATDIRNAIGFSSFAVLVYYSIANASALTLRDAWPRHALAVLGLAGCGLLAASLPGATVMGGAGLVAIGTAAYALQRHLRRP